jgi:SAM-dependent methyltransferase
VRSVTEFVLAHLPLPPARVLEVGCGEGALALALDAAGYEVTAIDPAAPEGPIFRRIKLEDVEEDARFDAVVASSVFHHMGENLELNLEHVARLLEGGPFVLDEFGWERLDAATADWYEGQRRALEAAGREPRGPSAAEWRHHYESHQALPSDSFLPQVRTWFEERHYEEVPFLHRYLDGVASAVLEEALIEGGAIRALGLRFVGVPRVGAVPAGA